MPDQLSSPPRIVTIPSTDAAFRAHVEHLRRVHGSDTAEGFGARLRHLYPRVLVRSRDLAHELPVWYVYRDGTWRPEAQTRWWTAARLGRMVLTLDGWIIGANPIARGLLGIGASEEVERYFSDFVAPGTLDDASSLFAIVSAGRELTATVRIRPTTGDVIAIELRAAREDDRVVCVMRLADDLDVESSAKSAPPRLLCVPLEDPVFRAYAEQLLERMSEPTPPELALRLRRLYPHARVEPEAGHWRVIRDPGAGSSDGSWWLDRSLPTVRFDEQGVILDANGAALALLGAPLVGRHWDELVTPGSHSLVSPVIGVIKEAGGAVSRFRMPSRDGSLVEFDSFTEVDGEILTTIMRPVDGAAGRDGASGGNGALHTP